MTAQQPAYTMGGLSHSAELFRRATYAGWCPLGGVFNPTACAIGAPGGMFVSVAEGEVLMPGGTTTTQGLYYGLNDATVSLAISAADPTHARIDSVCATVEDSNYAGGTTAWILQVITGTPASSPVPPTLPTGSVPLANVTVGATVTAINTGNISDTRYLVSGPDGIGTIKPWGSNTLLPAGYVTANGTGYSTTTYPDAFKIWGYTFGGAGATFAVPPINGRVLVGKGTASWTTYTLGVAAGSEQISTALPTHNHSASSSSSASVSDPTHYHAAQPGYDVIVQATSAQALQVGGTGVQAASNVGDPNTDAKFTGISVSVGTSTSIGNAGSSTNYNVPVLPVNYICRIL